MSDAPEDGRRSRRKGYCKRQIELEAAKQGLTVEEYGVYLKERKAVRLRRASGKTLQHPTRRAMVRD